MILFTTGYYYSFVRLFEAADEFARQTEEEVIVQGRECGYEFNNCHYKPFINDLNSVMKEASVVVTHGAMSLTEAIKYNGRIVICPRRGKYNEHINDHQVEFAEWIQEQYKVPVVLEMEELASSIKIAQNGERKFINMSNNEKLVGKLKAQLKSWASG